MRRLIAVTLLLISVSTPALSEILTRFALQTFAYSAPVKWYQYTTDGKNKYHHSRPDASNGALLVVYEQYIGDGNDVDMLFSQLSKVTAETDKYIRNDHDSLYSCYAVGERLINGKKEPVVCSFAISGDCMLVMIMVDTERDASDVLNLMLEISRSVRSINPVQTPIPIPTPSPTAQPTASPSIEYAPHPDKLSSDQLSAYHPFSYELAKYEPDWYEGRKVHLDGVVLHYEEYEEGDAFAELLVDRNRVLVYIHETAKPYVDIEKADTIEVYGISSGLSSTTPEYPVVIALLRVINRGLGRLGI